jgi:hypothetical protein
MHTIPDHAALIKAIQHDYLADAARYRAAAALTGRGRRTAHRRPRLLRRLVLHRRPVRQA